MQILYLATSVFSKGGIQRYSRSQIRALNQLGGTAHVLSVHPDLPGGFEEGLPVDFSGIGASPLGKAYYFLGAFVHALRHRPDVIWVNHIHLLPLALLLRVLAPQARVVVNVYGLELWSGRERQIQNTLPRADWIVSDCHFSARYIEETYGVTPDKISVIWDPVDVECFREVQVEPADFQKYGFPLHADARYLCTLGRLDSGAMHKGYDRLLDAMKILRKDPRLVCLIGGEGDQRPRLEQRVHDEGLEQVVFFLGNVPENELVKLYNLCHVFTLVSDRGPGRGEGVPLTPLEAAACGKPILVGNEDGSQEAVMDGENGYIVSPGELDVYCERVRRLMSDEDLRHRMGAAARRKIELDFSYAGFVSKHGQLLSCMQQSNEAIQNADFIPDSLL